MLRPSLTPLLLAGLLVCGCVEKDPDVAVKGPRPLSHTEKMRVKKHILQAPPGTLRYPVNGNLEDKILYLGLHTPEDTVVPGKPFHVFHYFQVKKAVPGWKLFVHTNGPGQSDFRNFDHVPVFGLHPVTSWKEGEIVEDRHTILLPKEVSYKTVDLYVGVWQGGKRLKVLSGSQDGSNRLLAARIPIGREGSPRRPAPVPTPEMLVQRSTGKIVIDGVADEADWSKAPFGALFRDSLKGTEKLPRTEVKLLWDDEHLYVFFQAEDDDVWATVTQNDDPKLWTEQAYEVFLDADGELGGYIEIQVNPRGAIFDAYLPRPGQTQADWQSGAQAKARVDGTLEDRSDKDRGWQVELAIPWASVKGRSTAPFSVPPPPGTKLRANFFRTDRPKDGALQAWAWSPPMRQTFHALERFGTLALVDAAAGKPKEDAPAPGGKGPQGAAADPMVPRAPAGMTPSEPPALGGVPAPRLAAPPAMAHGLHGGDAPVTAPPPMAPAAMPAGMGGAGGEG